MRDVYEVRERVQLDGLWRSRSMGRGAPEFLNLQYNTVDKDAVEWPSKPVALVRHNYGFCGEIPETHVTAANMSFG